MTRQRNRSPTARRDHEQPSAADLQKIYDEELKELGRERVRLELAHPRFTAEQLERLRARKLTSEQIGRLEELLPSFRSPRPRPRMQDVRDQLEGLDKAAQHLLERYARLGASKAPAAEQARSRLQFAQECLGYHDWRTLERCISTVATITKDARNGVSDAARGSAYRNPIGQILAALEPARFKVTRKRQPFLEIACVVSEASGEWSVDDAIRTFLKPARRE